MNDVVQHHLTPIIVMMYMYACTEEVMHMAMTRLNIQLPAPLKAHLEVLRAQGVTASGYIRWLLERELKAAKAQKGR